jgi:translation initiation factor IF-1
LFRGSLHGLQLSYNNNKMGKISGQMKYEYIKFKTVI